MVGALPAQQFAPLEGETFPNRAPAGRAVAAGDLDGDGWPDVVIGQDGAPPCLLHGLGGGAFAPFPSGSTPVAPMHARAVVLVDVDGDRDLDAVFGNVPGASASGTNALWLNDGRGAFTDASSRLPAHVDPTNALVAGDVDGDGDQDLAFVAGSIHLMRNNGSGVFTEIGRAHV